MTPKKRQTKKEKITQLEKQLNEAKAEAERYLSQLKYTKADLANMQKQNQRRLNDVMERANGQILEQLLPILDELEIFQTINDTDNDKLREGIGMVLKKLYKIIESEGVKPIKATGSKFDPFKHEAILEVETVEEPEGYVLEELRKGYTYKDRVLRASVVKVARSPRDQEEEEHE